MRDYLAGLTRRSRDRLEAGRRELAAHVETDAEGAMFVGGFLEWAGQVIAAASAALREHERHG